MSLSNEHFQIFSDNSAKSTDDHKFSNDWSHGHGKADAPAKSTVTSSSSPDANFERGKFKSDGT